MKNCIKLTVALVALLVSVIFMTSCETTDNVVMPTGPGEYIGEYDESMTPENSCVIYFGFMENFNATFKQINPELDIDEQTFSYSWLGSRNWTVFKPCKPGSRYMLTHFSGSGSTGVTTQSIWNMNFKPNQQIMVIDVPDEPGVYCYGIILGTDVAQCASEGKVYKVLPGDDPETDYLKTAVKGVDEKFGELYGETPWFDAYLEKRDAILHPKKD